MPVLEAFGVIIARRGSGSESGSTLISGEETNGLGGLLRLYSALLRIPLSDLVEVRVALEATAIRGTVTKASDADFDKLDAIIDTMRVATTPERFLEADTAFHLTIAELSGNSVLSLLMGELREAVAREMLRAFQRLEDFEPEHQWLIGERARLVAVIRSRDEAAAVQAISDHIRDFYSRVLQEEEPHRPPLPHGNVALASVDRARDRAAPLAETQALRGHLTRSVSSR
jgi:DNA-binding FadR family transcriptional regulator